MIRRFIVRRVMKWFLADGPTDFYISPGYWEKVAANWDEIFDMSEDQVFKAIEDAQVTCAKLKPVSRDILITIAILSTRLSDKKTCPLGLIRQAVKQLAPERVQ